MILVLFLCFIIFIISLSMFLTVVSTLKIDINNLKIYNWDKGINKEKLEKEFLINIGLYLFGKLKIFNLKIDNNKISKWNIKEKVKNMDFNKMKTDISLEKEDIKLLKKLQIDLEKFYLNLNVGTIDMNITTWVNFIIITLVSILLGKTIKQYDENKYKYQILPIYNNKNSLNLQLSSIIKVKMVHIINIVYVLIKRRRVDKNERTSNRRAYAYSHE